MGLVQPIKHMDKKEVTCIICGKKEFVSNSRFKKYKTCSKSCLGKYKTYPPNEKCKNCGKDIYIKPSKKSIKMGNFCSARCLSDYQKIVFLGDKNPNFKGLTRDRDGYVMENIPNQGNLKLHKFVVLEILKIKKIPSGYHIHHRDCNKLNNLPNNLVLLTISDHRWLHSQFGSAIMWGYYHGKISKELLIECSNDVEKTLSLIDLTIEKQIGLF